MRREVLTPPAKSPTELWIDEAIWGHRFYDEQTPWMILLELLLVLTTRRGVEPFCEEEGGGLTYAPPRRLELRNILFNSPFLDEVQRRGGDDSARWSAWLSRMQQEAEGVPDGADFSYLRAVFSSRRDSFSEFVEVVRLLRTTAIEGDSNKRWTSKFAFPYGPACLYPDLRRKPTGEFDMDRRFFARTGELAYLMLCRSGRGAELHERLRALLLDPTRPWNRLVERLQPPGSGAPQDMRVGYLPYASLEDFSAFANDLLAALDAQLPGYDVLPHLVDLIGLHLALYILRRAAEWSPEEGPVRLVLEIVAPRKTTLRDLAIESFASNCRRSGKAVERYIAEVLERGDVWRAACALGDDAERAEALQAALRDVLRVEPGLIGGGADPNRVLEDLRERASRRHQQHLGEAHGAYAQAIGLASRRGTRRTRYAPSDQLLKTLVLTVVPERMEFQKFLQCLWERYHMVIGHHQAADILREGESDQRSFEDNARRLEMRLESLGLLTRLSDACAYVESPVRGVR
jgi:hypothetical protein